MDFEKTLAQGTLLRISSDDKQPGQTNSDFSVILNNASNVQRVKGIAIQTISFKHAFSNIFLLGDGTTNAIFRFMWGGVLTTATVAAGWYTADELAAELTTQIALLPIALTVVLGAGPTFQRKFEFTGDGLTTFGLLSQASGNTMAGALGITVDTVEDVSPKTADSLPQLGGIPLVYVCSPELSDSQMSSSEQNGSVVPVLAAVPVTVPFGSQITYQPFEGANSAIMFRSERNLNQVGIRLCTRSGSTLPLDANSLTIILKLL